MLYIAYAFDLIREKIPELADRIIIAIKEEDSQVKRIYTLDGLQRKAGHKK